ncbi:MAG: ABC transporter permease [Bdellovibrionales bacterium]|nr:ABC transporter permease [Bdellovibrionales bacterium]
MLAWLIFRNYLLSRRAGALVRIIAWHCIFGVSMGVAALIIVLSVMNGFNQTIRSRMLNVEAHLLIPQKERPTAEGLRAMAAVLEKVTPGAVDKIERYETQDLILRSTDGVFGGAVAKGYEDSTVQGLLSRVWEVTHKNTPPPQSESAELGANEVIIGVDLARSLGIFEGDEVILVPPEVLLLPKGEIPKFQKFQVKSLLNTQMPEFDSKFMYYNLDRFPDRMRSASREMGYEVRLHNPYDADSVKKRLQENGIASQTWGERDTSLFFALKMESAAMTLFLSLAVLITSFSIVIIMVLLMSQKRQDIGMLMALGMSVRRTQRLFLKVGLLLSFIGIFTGVILGSAVCLFLDYHKMELLPDIYTDSTLPAKLTMRILVSVLVGSSLIAVVGAWLPVWRNVLKSPSESLRRQAP